MNKITQLLIEKVSVSLARYEADSPHVDLPCGDFSKDTIYPDITWDEINEALESDHLCDRTEFRGIHCTRCWSEMIVDKAKYIVNRLPYTPTQEDMNNENCSD